MSFCWERDMASISIGFGDNRHKFYSLYTTRTKKLNGSEKVPDYT